MDINREVPPPYAIQLEPAEGCSLACSFCGIQSIRDNGADAELNMHGKNSAPYRFAELATIERVAKQAAKLGWNPRFELAMHGEPSMHPDIAGIVRVIRKHNPRAYIMMTSNGSGFLKDAEIKIDTLFAAGLNTLALDDYEHSGGWVPKIVGWLKNAEFFKLNNVQFYEYPADSRGNPHHRHNKRMLSVIHDISENETGNHQLTNQGGNSFKTEPLAERCAKPFRELSVRWDGNVALCCDDWKGEYKVGNVNDLPLEDIWYSQEFEAARRHLYAKDRAFGPCTGCNVRTSRNGLLPDKLGKSEMQAPNVTSRAVVARALRGKIFTMKLAKGD